MIIGRIIYYWMCLNMAFAVVFCYGCILGIIGKYEMTEQFVEHGFYWMCSISANALVLFFAKWFFSKKNDDDELDITDRISR